jgi:hypothetical protein
MNSEHQDGYNKSFQKAMENETWLGGGRSMRYPSGKLLILW